MNLGKLIHRIFNAPFFIFFFIVLFLHFVMNYKVFKKEDTEKRVFLFTDYVDTNHKNFKEVEPHINCLFWLLILISILC